MTKHSPELPRKKHHRSVYPYPDMKVGDSFRAHPRAAAAAWSWKSYYPGWDFKTRAIEPGVIEITRLA